MDQLVVLQEIYESFAKGGGLLRTINPKSITGNSSDLIAKLLESCLNNEVDEGICQKLAERLDGLYEIKRLGDICRRAGFFNVAIRCYNRALTMTDDPHVKHVLHSNLGDVYGILGDLERAVQTYEKAAEGFRSLGDSVGLAHVLGNLGSAYRRSRRWDEALKSCTKSLKIFEKLGDESGVAQMTGSLGRIYAEMGEGDLALDQYKRSLRDFERLGDRRNVAWLHNRIGRVYAQMKSWDAASKNYNKSVSIFEDLGQYQSVGVVLSNLGRLYLEKGDPVAARNYLERGLKLIRREMKPIYPNAVASLAATYLKLARKYQEEAFHQIESSRDRSIRDKRDEVSRMAAEYYAKASDRYQELYNTPSIGTLELKVTADLTRSLSFLARSQSETNGHEVVALLERAIAAMDGAVANAESARKYQIESLQRTLLGMREAWRISISRDEPWRLSKIVSDAIEYLMGGAYRMGEISQSGATGAREASRCIYDALKSMSGAIDEERRRGDPAPQLASVAANLRRAEKRFDLMQTDIGRDSSRQIGRAAQLVDRMIDLSRGSAQQYQAKGHQIEGATDLMNYKAHRSLLLFIGWVQVRTTLAGMNELDKIFTWDDTINQIDSVDGRKSKIMKNIFGEVRGKEPQIKLSEPISSVEDDLMHEIDREQSTESKFSNDARNIRLSSLADPGDRTSPKDSYPDSRSEPPVEVTVSVASDHPDKSQPLGSEILESTRLFVPDDSHSESQWQSVVEPVRTETADLVPVKTASLVWKSSPLRRDKPSGSEDKDAKLETVVSISEPERKYLRDLSKGRPTSDRPIEDQNLLENGFETVKYPRFWRFRKLRYSFGKSRAYKALLIILALLLILLGIDMALYYLAYSRAA